MPQPIKKRKKQIVGEIKGTGNGFKFCDECPFLTYENGVAKCSPNDVFFEKKEHIQVPEWCGNKK